MCTCTQREISKTQCVQSTRVTDKLWATINQLRYWQSLQPQSQAALAATTTFTAIATAIALVGLPFWTPIRCSLFGSSTQHGILLLTPHFFSASLCSTSPLFALGTFTSRDNARRAAVRDNGTYHPPVRTGPALWKC